MALRFSHITVGNFISDPNLWTVHRGADGFVWITDETGKIVDEPHETGMALLSDFSIICYAIGWLNSTLQEPL